MKRAHKSHSQFVQNFLSISKFNVPIMRQDTLFIGKGALMGKLSKGGKGKERDGQGD